jgi:hypothetical protein
MRRETRGLLSRLGGSPDSPVPSSSAQTFESVRQMIQWPLHSIHRVACSRPREHGVPWHTMDFRQATVRLREPEALHAHVDVSMPPNFGDSPDNDAGLSGHQEAVIPAHGTRPAEASWLASPPSGCAGRRRTPSGEGQSPYGLRHEGGPPATRQLHRRRAQADPHPARRQPPGAGCHLHRKQHKALQPPDHAVDHFHLPSLRLFRLARELTFTSLFPRV